EYVGLIRWALGFPVQVGPPPSRCLGLWTSRVDRGGGFGMGAHWMSKNPKRVKGPRGKRSGAELTVAQVVVWAKAHRAASGHWPRADSGPVAGISGETWWRIANALQRGLRGLPAGLTLSHLEGELWRDAS